MEEIRNDLTVDNNEDGLRTVRLDGVEKNVYMGASSVIGRRHEQQDAVRIDADYSFIETGKTIAVLCDGMGGLTGGGKASALCSSIVLDSFHQVETASIPDFYRSVIGVADREVKALKDADENPLGAGTTMVSVSINESDLYWASVGDSRIYIIRGEEIICITHDHNYGMLLQEKVRRGEITQEEADNHPKKEALVSYIGIGGVRYIDINSKPFQLMNGDHLVLCSDGLYRSVTEEEIKQTVRQHGKNVQLAAKSLTDLALSKNRKNQDNTSVIVIGYEDSG